MSTYTVYASMAEDVRKKLEKLAKKAATYKVSFSFSESEEHPETVRVVEPDPVGHTLTEVDRYTVAAIDFDIECDGLIRANGWSVRAKIEHGENGNIVTGFGSKPVDDRWYRRMRFSLKVSFRQAKLPRKHDLRVSVSRIQECI